MRHALRAPDLGPPASAARLVTDSRLWLSVRRRGMARRVSRDNVAALFGVPDPR